MSTTDLILIHTHTRLGDARGNAPRFCPVHQVTIDDDLTRSVRHIVTQALKGDGYHWCAKCAGWHK